jgi:hypothetical protein
MRSVMERAEIERHLERYRAELTDAERDAQAATRLRNSLRQVVAGFEGLLEAKLSPNERQLQVGDQGHGTDSATVEVQAVQEKGERTPAGSEAVRLVLADANGEPRSLQEVIAEIEARNWMSKKAKHPHAGIRAALHRLLAEGEIERVARGTYRLPHPDENRPEWEYP